MSSTFSIALSALQADSDAINTTGNNLANLNTTGFKESNVQFESLLSEYLGGAAAGGLGLGVTPPISEQVFSQGALQTSELPLATAIQGNGFFVLEGANNLQEFTRDGSFQQAADGTLETQTGEKVQGWMATNGVVNATGAPTDLVLPTGTLLPPVATTSMTAQINLDPAASSSGSATTFSAPIQVVDSLGNTQTLSVNFTQSATANTWTYNVTIPGSAVSGGGSGNVNLLSTPGTLSFNADGTLSSSVTSPVALSISGLADGAANMNINWNLLDSSGNPTITQFAQASSLASSQQNGLQAAQLLQVTIQNGGQIMANYSNGQQVLAGQLALASIQNPDSLINIGNNNFTVGGDTAVPAIGLPQSGGLGQIIGGSLESSNVDMGTEFTNLIVYQSSYGANSKVITTANTMEQDLLSLIQ